MSTLYLDRYAYPQQLDTHPAEDLGLTVVIPCHREPDLITTLESLSRCMAPPCGFEVIVVLNEAQNASAKITQQNNQTFQDIQYFQKVNQLPVQVIQARLSPKHAGVGLARKIGMDEAVRRFEHISHDGIIVALDADCTVAPNYLINIYQHFQLHKKSPGCSLYYEHPLQGDLDSHLYKGIAAYELHLRYYTHALRFSGHPFAFQTVGSAMAVRSSAYQKQGGMNRRQAGEDFYFLQNIFLLGNFTELNNTVVYPSARISKRVPFGTGRAQQIWAEANGHPFMSYNYQTFEDLKSWLKLIPNMHSLSLEDSWVQVPESLQEFIGYTQYKQKVEAIKSQSKDLNGFIKRFYYWCNGVFAFKFAHHARDHHYANIPIEQGAAWLLKNQYNIKPKEEVLGLLDQYRAFDRKKV